MKKANNIKKVLDVCLKVPNLLKSLTLLYNNLEKV